MVIKGIFSRMSWVFRSEKQRNRQRLEYFASAWRRACSENLEMLHDSPAQNERLKLKAIHGDDIVVLEAARQKRPLGSEGIRGIEEPQLQAVWEQVIRIADELDRGVFLKPEEQTMPHAEISGNDQNNVLKFASVQ
jgi:hypothetical protein